MRLCINGEEYEVPMHFQVKLLNDLIAQGEADYREKVPAGWRIAGQGLARMILESMEKKAAKQIGKAMAKEVLCPPRRADPVPFLARVFAKLLLKGMESIDVHCQLDAATRTVETFHLTVKQSAGEAGRQVDFDRDERLREDHRPQIS